MTVAALKTDSGGGSITDRAAFNQNPTDIGFWALLAEDFRTHGHSLGSPGFWTVAVHRFGNWRMSTKRPLRIVLTAVYTAASRAMRWGWRMDVSYDIKLGRRVRLDHPGPMVIGARSIGNDVVIRRGATLGLPRQGAAPDAVPVIEDGVEIGPRACVVGPVRVGKGALVCGNSVVAVDVPPHVTVLGVPGRVVDLRRHLDTPLAAVDEADSPPAE